MIYVIFIPNEEINKVVLHLRRNEDFIEDVIEFKKYFQGLERSKVMKS